jgi:ferric-dicitrate binding protein FerR (iron transport regulator)
MKRSLWVLFAASVVLAGANALQGAGPDNQWLGVLWTKGSVSVGDAKVCSGTTVLPGDVITTDHTASAWIRFRLPASTTLLPDTQLTLLASNSAPSLLLRHGSIVVDEKVSDPVQVAVPGGYVVIKGDPQTGAECELASIDNGATVSVKRGMAEIHGTGTPMILHAGQSARVEASPDGGQPIAGKINKVIPQGEIHREGQPQELPLALNVPIDWNDLVRTLQTGRAQITLLDGSTLNLGARSELKVLKHDAQAQQTQLELTVGKLEANVQKITAPGGKFQLRSKSAVIGTIDTAFVATVDGDVTKVCGVEGSTLVQSSDPSIQKSVVLHRNECTIVMPGAPPTDPVVDPAMMSELLNDTAISGAEVAGAGAGAGAGGLAIAGSHIPWVWIGVGAGAAAAGIITGVVVSSSSSSTSPTTP